MTCKSRRVVLEPVRTLAWAGPFKVDSCLAPAGTCSTFTLQVASYMTDIFSARQNKLNLRGSVHGYRSHIALQGTCLSLQAGSKNRTYRFSIAAGVAAVMDGPARQIWWQYMLDHSMSYRATLSTTNKSSRTWHHIGNARGTGHARSFCKLSC